MSLVNLLLLITRFSFIHGGQTCRERIAMVYKFRYFEVTQFVILCYMRILQTNKQILIHTYMHTYIYIFVCNYIVNGYDSGNQSPRDCMPIHKPTTLQWRHYRRDGVSNHQHRLCLLNRLFRRRSKKISKLRVTGLCTGNSPVTGEFPPKWPVTRKMFPFDDVTRGLSRIKLKILELDSPLLWLVCILHMYAHICLEKYSTN